MKRSWLSLSVVALLALQGCYVFKPLQTSAPPAGESVVLHINDRGRVALGERLGPGVSRIQGRVLSVGEEQVAVSVASVGYVSGEKSLWSGESVTMSREYVGHAEIRELSRGRTWTAVGATTVVVGTFIATRGLSAIFGNLPRGPGDDGDGPTTFRLKFGFNF